ncbi:hypothetical protein [Streptacidiphilus sp. MAP5-52]|uniref:hypothetical protein n=1 Tax=Streptacidiphilus sp. MAP5-52 TaxID=3156267 RepID=UPI003511307C
MNPHPDGTATTQRPTKETHLPSDRNDFGTVTFPAIGSGTTWTTSDAVEGAHDLGRG